MTSLATLREDLVRAVQAFLATPNWREAHGVVRQHGVLLTDDADVLLSQMIETAQARQLEAEARVLAEHRTFLRRARQGGAAEELVGQAGGTAPPLGEGPAVPEGLRADVDRAEECRLRYERDGRPEELDDALAAWGRAFGHPDFAAADPALRSAMHNNAAGLHHRRYLLRGEPADLDRALTSWHGARELAAPGSPAWADCSNNLGNAHRSRYAASGDVDALAAAIEAYRRAADATPAESPDRPFFQNNLATGLFDRYVREGSADDLDKALQLWRDAAESIAPDAPDAAARLNNLGHGYLARYLRAGEASDLEEAIRAWEQALGRVPPTSPDFPAVLNNAGVGWKARYERTGDRQALDQAIAYSGRALDHTHEGSPDRPARLNNLGVGLLARYGEGGERNDLDRAIELLGAAVAASPPGAPHLPDRLGDLGEALRARFHRGGVVDDLEDAVRRFEWAVEQTPACSPDAPLVLHRLALGLRDRYDLTGRRADLKRALALGQDAVAATPPRSPNRLEYLDTLAGVWRRLGEQGGPGDALDQAVSAAAEALEQGPPDAPALPSVRATLASALRARHEREEARADLERAARLVEEALRTVPAASPRRPEYLTEQGLVLRLLARLTGRVADREGGAAALREAAHAGLRAALPLALRGAVAWGHWALEQGAFDEAVAGYRLARRAAERLIRGQECDEHRRGWVRHVQGLAASEAYALARRGNPGVAVRLLEDDRPWLLADALRRVEGELPPDDALLGAAREARPRDVVKGLADVDALVYLAATPAGSLALVVTPDRLEPAWLDLTDAALDDLVFGEAAGARAAFHTVGGRGPGYFDQQRVEARDFPARLGELLGHLGERLMGPLADRLRGLGARRVVLVPIGRMALLPLHAAVYTAGGRRHYFLEEFTVSFAPSARALAVAHLEARRRAEGPFLVGVGNPLPSARPLPGTAAEVMEVADLFPPHRRRVLVGVEATRDGLLGALPQGTHLHLACSGDFDRDGPLGSWLELGGEDRLTVADLASGAAAPARARLVVLASCQSALSDYLHLPDEYVGFPGALLGGGVPGVVGSLWFPDDLGTLLLMVRFYEHLLQGGPDGGRAPLPPAEALRRAQLWLKQASNDELARFFRERQRAGRLPEQTALALIGQFALSDPEARPLENAPEHWACFIHIGV